MINTLQKQYVLLKGTREIMFNFIETTVGNDLNTPVPVYENNTIRYLLAHTANCYFHWLAYFALKHPVQLLNDQDLTSLSKIRHLYTRVDDTVSTFFENFKEEMDIPIPGTFSNGDELSATPLQLFTHVFSHEFHHKGQIMLMCRILGHMPPDTDVSNMFNYH